jgi:hypothetical protein
VTCQKLNGEEFAVTIQPGCATVAHLKLAVEKLTGIPHNQQQLYASNEDTLNDSLLHFSSVIAQDSDVVHNGRANAPTTFVLLVKDPYRFSQAKAGSNLTVADDGKRIVFPKDGEQHEEAPNDNDYPGHAIIESFEPGSSVKLRCWAYDWFSSDSIYSIGVCRPDFKLDVPLLKLNSYFCPEDSNQQDGCVAVLSNGMLYSDGKSTKAHHPAFCGQRTGHQPKQAHIIELSFSIDGKSFKWPCRPSTKFQQIGVCSVSAVWPF